MIKTCEYCGKEFETNRGNAKYCSEECRQTLFRELYRVERKCRYCGKTFSPKEVGKYCYCSDECQKKAYKEQQKKQNKSGRKQNQKNENKCKYNWKCYYARNLQGNYNYCAYIEIEGHSRGCDPTECDKHKPKKRGRKPCKIPPQL